MNKHGLHERARAQLAAREKEGTLRTLQTRASAASSILNLADNDYLALANDAALKREVLEKCARLPLSASASALVGGHLPCHADFEAQLALAYGFPTALLWNSGYAANAGILGALAQREDLIFCDRLIHRSMIEGIRHSGARFFRFAHNDCAHLEALLARHPAPEGAVRWVLAESVYSMDGDSPDLRRMADICKRHGCLWMLDEAHALGWFGCGGLGLAQETGVLDSVDIFVGTLGKTCASQGAFTLFRDTVLREFVANFCPEFIYSTYLSPLAAIAAQSAWQRMRLLAKENAKWRAASLKLRESLRRDGWLVPLDRSAIVPVGVEGGNCALEQLCAFLKANGVLAGAIRPPTVPKGGQRLRLSLKRTLDENQIARVKGLLAQWRNRAL